MQKPRNVDPPIKPGAEPPVDRPVLELIAAGVGYVGWLWITAPRELSPPVDWLGQGMAMAACSLIAAICIVAPRRPPSLWAPSLLPAAGRAIGLLAVWSAAALGAYVHGERFAIGAWMAALGTLGLVEHRRYAAQKPHGCSLGICLGLLVLGLAVMIAVAVQEPFEGQATPVETGGNYPPVTEHMLSGARLTNRTGGPAFNDLTWEFTESRFVIEAGPSGLPDDLTAALAPDMDPATTKQIEGAWRLDGETLVFTGVSADGVPLDSAPRRLPTFHTGVLRIETNEAQYVFHRR